MTNKVMTTLETKGAMTVRDLAGMTHLSQSRVRELLKLAGDKVTRTGKPAVFALVDDNPEEELIGKEKKTRSKFLGHPEAKRNKNPQSTINAKKDAIKADGGSMTFDRKDRIWDIVNGSGEAQRISSTYLASLTLEAFKAEFIS